MRSSCAVLVQSPSAYSARDYFGWDPRSEALSEKGGREVISDAHVSTRSAGWISTCALATALVLCWRESAVNVCMFLMGRRCSLVR